MTSPGFTPTARMRIAATMALIVMAAVFAATHVWGRDEGVWGYVRAFAEAGLVGGLADWFAVTAIFRRPLGLPIPHTAVIPRNKQRIADAVGRFIAENFLDPALVAERLEDGDPGARIGEWLADRSQADRLARGLVAAAPDLLSLLDDEAVARFWRRRVAEQTTGARIAPVVGSVLEALTAEGKHQILLNAALKEGFAALETHEERIRAAVREQSHAVLRFTRMDRKVADGLIGAIEDLLHDMAVEPDHPARKRLTEIVEDFARDLREDAALQARLERIVAEALAHPALADVADQGWREARAAVIADAGKGADSKAAGWIADGLAGLGEAILSDAEARAAFNARLRPALVHLAERHGRDVARIVSETIASWDADTVVDKLEANVGRDLQYIRLNGTLIGGLVGVTLHALTTWV
ncbi:DUF445 domain-containing protein [Marinicauda salina]|nr:DUF445 domain-containing protein [Marinicauda salina]